MSIPEIVPSLSVKDGKGVIVEGKAYKTITKNGRPWPPENIVEVLSKNYEKAVVLDINGISDGKPHFKMLQRITGDIKLWIDGGVRYVDHIYDLFMAGADKVIVGTKTLRSLSELEKMLSLSEDIVVSVDYAEGVISPNPEIAKMSVSSLIRRLCEIGCYTFIISYLKNVDYTLLSDVPADASLYVTGHLSDREKVGKKVRGLIVSIGEVVKIE